MPYCRLNGFDITRYIEANGFQESENDLDGPNAGRPMSTLMHRDKLGEKKKADIKLVYIKKRDLDRIIPILRNEYFLCETDLFPGNDRILIEMYCSTRKYGVSNIDIFGNVWYFGASFNIIER